MDKNRKGTYLVTKHFSIAMHHFAIFVEWRKIYGNTYGSYTLHWFQRTAISNGRRSFETGLKLLMVFRVVLKWPRWAFETSDITWSQKSTLHHFSIFVEWSKKSYTYWKYTLHWFERTTFSMPDGHLGHSQMASMGLWYQWHNLV